MAFCRQCGKQIDDGMVICNECNAANQNANGAVNNQQVNNGGADNNQQVNNGGAVNNQQVNNGGAVNNQQFNNAGNVNNQQNYNGANNANTSTQNNTFVNDAVNSVTKFVKEFLDTNDRTGAYNPAEIQQNKIICALAYIPILFWLPLVAGTKGSKYCKFHANQGLLLLIVSVIFSILNIIIGALPVVGYITWPLASLVELGLFLFGLIYTATGKSKELPIIGGIEILQ